MGIPGKPKMPDTPDASSVIGQSTAANREAGIESQRGSMVDQNNAYGSSTWAQTGTGPGGIPTYGNTVKYSPEQQAMLNYLQGTKTEAGRAGSELMTNANYGDVPDLSTGTNSRVTQRLGQAAEYFNPVFKTQTDNLDNQLRNQGIVPGMKAFTNQTRDLRDTQDRAVSNMIQEMQPQAFQQSVQEYGLPAEMSTKLAQFGAPVDPTQQFQNAPQLNVAPANVQGAYQNQFNNQMSIYDKQKAQFDAMIKGIMGGASAIVGGPIAGMAGQLGQNMFNGGDMGMGSWAPQ